MCLTIRLPMASLDEPDNPLKIVIRRGEPQPVNASPEPSIRDLILQGMGFYPR